MLCTPRCCNMGWFTAVASAVVCLSKVLGSLAIMRLHAGLCLADKEELSAKIQQLEERLNDKKEALLEKELILEEITNLSNKLRSQVRTLQSRCASTTHKHVAHTAQISAVPHCGCLYCWSCP